MTSTSSVSLDASLSVSLVATATEFETVPLAELARLTSNENVAVSPAGSVPTSNVSSWPVAVTVAPDVPASRLTNVRSFTNVSLTVTPRASPGPELVTSTV